MYLRAHMLTHTHTSMGKKSLSRERRGGGSNSSTWLCTPKGGVVWSPNISPPRSNLSKTYPRRTFTASLISHLLPYGRKWTLLITGHLLLFNDPKQLLVAHISALPAPSSNLCRLQHGENLFEWDKYSRWQQANRSTSKGTVSIYHLGCGIGCLKNFSAQFFSGEKMVLKWCVLGGGGMSWNHTKLSLLSLRCHWLHTNGLFKGWVRLHFSSNQAA